MTIPYITVIIVVGFIYYIHNWIAKRRKHYEFFRRVGIQNPTPHLIYGNFEQIRGNKKNNPICVVEEWILSYGKIFGFFSGQAPYLIVADLDMAKEILVKEFSNFTNRPRLIIESFPVMDSLVGLRDGRWKQVRSVLAPTFSMAKMKLQTMLIHPKIDIMMNVIENKRLSNDTFEWHNIYQALTLDVISECALAMKTNCQEEQNDNDFLYSVRQYMKYAISPVIVFIIYFPTLAKIMGFICDTLSFPGRMTTLITSNLIKVLKSRQLRTHHTKDVLQLMLDSQNKTSLNAVIGKNLEINSVLKDDEIIGNSWIFVIAGFETSSSALTYTSYLLALNPSIQDKLYDELVISIGLKEVQTLKYEDVKSLNYLDQVLNESLRLYPPIVNFISREAKNDILIGKYLIPKGTNVQIPVWHIHRDPEHWPNPEKFDPDRFRPEEVKRRHPMAHIPFGAGPRHCIGMKFALLEIKLTLARILLKYKLEISDKTEYPLKFEVPTVSLCPVNGVYLKAALRS